MSWIFEQKPTCDLFWQWVSTPKEGEVFQFSCSGEDAGEGLVRSRAVSALVGGSSTTIYPDHGTYESEDFAHINPLAGRKQVTPAGVAQSVAGPGLEYWCASPRPMADGTGLRKLDYNVIRGQEQHTSTCEVETYFVPVRGTMTIGDVTFEKYEIARRRDPGDVVMTLSPDAIVFKIWER